MRTKFIIGMGTLVSEIWTVKCWANSKAKMQSYCEQ